MRRARANGMGAAEGRGDGTASKILVGGTYLDIAGGLVVCVLDSDYSAAGRTGRFVVAPANGARPGARWVRSAGELVEEECEAASMGQHRPVTLLHAAREALRCTKRLLTTGEGVLFGEDIAQLAAETRAVGDKLAVAACLGLAARRGGGR